MAISDLREDQEAVDHVATPEDQGHAQWIRVKNVIGDALCERGREII